MHIISGVHYMHMFLVFTKSEATGDAGPLLIEHGRQCTHNEMLPSVLLLLLNLKVVF